MVWVHEFELRNQRRVFALEAGETLLRRAVSLEAANQKRRGENQGEQRGQEARKGDVNRGEEDHDQADPGREGERNQEDHAHPEAVFPRRGLIAEQLLDEMLGVLGAEDPEAVNARLDRKGTSHVRMVSQQAVVLAKGVFRASKDEPAGGHRKFVDRLGLDRATFELPGNPLIDVGVERASAISIHRDPADLAFPVQPLEDLGGAGLEKACKVSRERTGIEQEQRRRIGSRLDHVPHDPGPGPFCSEGSPARGSSATSNPSLAPTVPPCSPHGQTRTRIMIARTRQVATRSGDALMTTATEVWEIPIAGMTCDHCVRTVSHALSSVPGVESARVDLPGARAEVTVDPSRVDLETLRTAVEAAGYSVPTANGRTNGPAAAPAASPAQLVTIGSIPRRAPGPDQSRQQPAPAGAGDREQWELAISGMHCASCVARVEDALGGVSGVHEARVNLATERAAVTVDPSRTDLDQLVSSVARAGYTARRQTLSFGAQAAEQLRRERALQVGYWRRRLEVGIAGAVPLVLLGLGSMVVPALQDAAWVGWCMFGLAAILQVYLGGSYIRGAWQRLLQRSSNMDTLIALGTATAFLYSTVHLLLGHIHQAHFFMDAGIILTLITL